MVDDVCGLHAQVPMTPYISLCNRVADFENGQMLKSIDLDEKAPARLLPKFDSFVLGHKDRARIIKLEHLKKVYRPKIGDVAATLLINGQITGTWKHEKTKATLRITITPFTKV